MKTITICGSMKFFSEMKALETKLGNLGFRVFSPSQEGQEIDYSKLDKKEQVSLKKSFIDKHIAKIKKADAILIANYDKSGIKNYIGANTFLEMAFAYVLGKKIFLLNGVPEQDNSLEIEGLGVVVLDGDLNKIK